MVNIHDFILLKVLILILFWKLILFLEYQVNFGRVGTFFDGWVKGERFKFVTGISKSENILVVLATAAGKFCMFAKVSE